MESGQRKLLKNPRDSSNLISILFFGWSIPFFKRSYQKVLHPNDVFEPCKVDRSQFVGDRLERAWEVELKSMEKPRLVRAVCKAFWPELLLLGILCFVSEFVLRIGFAIVLKQFLDCFHEKSPNSSHDAVINGIFIFVLTVINGICFLHSFYNGAYYAMKIRVALSSLIFRKTLRLSQKSLAETAPGKLVNLLSNDVQRFETLFCLHSLWIAPLSTIAATYLLWIEIQWAGIIGIATILSFIPIQSYAGKLTAKIRFKIALRTDERVRFMDEIILGVQVIKMYAWEKPFEQLIELTRRLEMESVLKSTYVRALYMAAALFTNRFALFCTVLSFVLLYGSENMTIPKMFMATYLYNCVSFLMNRGFVRGISEMGEAYMALKRLQMFLESEEKIETIENDSEQTDSNVAISMKNATAEWVGGDSQENSTKSKKKTGYKNGAPKEAASSTTECTTFKLHDINLTVPKGQLILVIGSVGSGKSTLLQVLLKELPLLSGSMDVNGSISYASQESWIFASTIRQNITFGQPMDRTRYDSVIKSAAMITDLRQFSDGDMTFVGENGAGLSGGQKARINLARAMYRKADIYLIDDPLSAVDSHVQKHLFSECLGPDGFLAQLNATRILVTHQLHFMKQANWIVIVNEGKIEIQGNYDTIIRSGTDFTDINPDENTEEEKEETEENMEINKSGTNSVEENVISLYENSAASASLNKQLDKLEGKKTFRQEEKGLVRELEASSHSKGSLLWKYFNFANQPFLLVFLMSSFLLTQALASVADVWISYWIKKEENRQHQEQSSVLSKIYTYNNENATNFEVNSIHVELADSEVNLWATEIYVIIYSIIMAVFIVITTVRSVILSNICCAASRNLHNMMFGKLIATPMRFFDNNPAGRIMNRFTKDLGSVDEILPRSILDAFQNNLTVIGAIVVTIFTDVKLSIVILLMGALFILIRNIYLNSSNNLKRLEGITKSPVFTHISATLYGLSTVRAFQAQTILRDEFENHQDLNTAAFFMFNAVNNGFGMIAFDLIVYIFLGCILYFFLEINEGVTGDRIGLAITQSLSLLTSLQIAVRYSADVENQLMSAERIFEYCELEPEKEPDFPEIVPADWPSQGKIEFKSVSYRYSNDGVPVLRGLTFAVEPSEKVSVVGRTGAGKSSLIGSIFRLAIVDGDILLDSVNTSRIALSVLRSRISIIPQVPILFSGTLRRNLDPFEEYSDDDIWTALENVEMKEIVTKNDGLQMQVMARGQNFSTGQRQILCLARAILRKNKIIILDEATANVDLQTDAMIQRTIREKFAECTVITVAHRLNTVIDSDRVLVMDAGVAVEFDAPINLLHNQESIFHKMVEVLGPQEYDKLYSLAEEKKKPLKPNPENNIK